MQIKQVQARECSAIWSTVAHLKNSFNSSSFQFKYVQLSVDVVARCELWSSGLILNILFLKFSLNVCFVSQYFFTLLHCLSFLVNCKIVWCQCCQFWVEQQPNDKINSLQCALDVKMKRQVAIVFFIVRIASMNFKLFIAMRDLWPKISSYGILWEIEEKNSSSIDKTLKPDEMSWDNIFTHSNVSVDVSLVDSTLEKCFSWFYQLWQLLRRFFNGNVKSKNAPNVFLIKIKSQRLQTKSFSSNASWFETKNWYDDLSSFSWNKKCEQ